MERGRQHLVIEILRPQPPYAVYIVVLNTTTAGLTNAFTLVYSYNNILPLCSCYKITVNPWGKNQNKTENIKIILENSRLIISTRETGQLHTTNLRGRMNIRDNTTINGIYHIDLALHLCLSSPHAVLPTVGHVHESILILVLLVDGRHA